MEIRVWELGYWFWPRRGLGIPRFWGAGPKILLLMIRCLWVVFVRDPCTREWLALVLWGMSWSCIWRFPGPLFGGTAWSCIFRGVFWSCIRKIFGCQHLRIQDWGGKGLGCLGYSNQDIIFSAILSFVLGTLLPRLFLDLGWHSGQDLGMVNGNGKLFLSPPFHSPLIL